MGGRVLVAVCVVVLFAHAPAFGQQIRYMDSSGNIHFVDSIHQVPQRYRQQVETPTPVPVLDAKAQAAKRRQEQEAKRQQEAEARQKQNEERRRKREEERLKQEEAKQNRRKGKASGFGRLL